MSKLREKAKKYLAENPGAEVHGCPGDPQAFLFHRKQDAHVHAATLEDQTVESFGASTSNIEVNEAQTISGNQIEANKLTEAKAEADKKAAAAEKAEATKKAAADKLAKAKADTEAKKEADAKAKAEADQKAADDAEAKAKAEAEPKPEASEPTKKKTTKK